MERSRQYDEEKTGARPNSVAGDARPNSVAGDARPNSVAVEGAEQQEPPLFEGDDGIAAYGTDKTGGRAAAYGKSVDKVDYNPYIYIHIRPDKVNKQFKQAWERPNLVYVEVEYQ